VAVTPHPPPASPHVRRLWIAGAILAVVALGALAAWWLTHPTWFLSTATVHLDAVAAHVVSDSSAATVTAYVCTNRPQPGPGVSGRRRGDDASAVHAWCGSMTWT